MTMRWRHSIMESNFVGITQTLTLNIIGCIRTIESAGAAFRLDPPTQITIQD